MNKINKIWLNNILNTIISLVLIWFIYQKIIFQISNIRDVSWHQTGSWIYLWLCFLFFAINISLEVIKWFFLVNIVEQVSFYSAIFSYFAGMAFSIVTPNRIGEYPGRILYLGKANTVDYINVSLLGTIVQLLSVFIFGFVAILYYYNVYPSFMSGLSLLFCFSILLFSVLIYLKHESWLLFLKRFKWSEKILVYFKIFTRFTSRMQLLILCISLLRFAVYTSQFLMLLLWLNIKMPLIDGWCLSALFFWIMTVIPSVSLSEIGIRSAVSIYLFQQYSQNSVGIVVATVGIWFINLILPSLVGCIIMFKMKIFK